MTTSHLSAVTTLTFDIFGTVLDLTGSITPPTRAFLDSKGATISAETFWNQWRARQRIEQYQDSLIMLGHSGYLETCRRALLYCLRLNRIDFTDAEVRSVMQAWQELTPHGDVVEGMQRLKTRYKLVALSNGGPAYLEHLAKERMPYGFDAIISAQTAGFFKPHPSVYSSAVRQLDLEPHQVMMVAAHAFDIMGARACGLRGAYINRYELPYEETPFRPDIEVSDFAELADNLGL